MAAVLMAAALAGCSAPEKGTVLKKDYSPSYTTTSWNCVSYDKKGFCNLQVPTSHYWPETWHLYLRDGEDEGWRGVDQVTYHEYEIGETYP